MLTLSKIYAVKTGHPQVLIVPSAKITKLRQYPLEVIVKNNFTQRILSLPFGQDAKAPLTRSLTWREIG